MKKTVLTFIAFLFLTNVFGQKTEVKVLFNSGFFKFSGPYSRANTSINYSEVSHSGYTNNPYGTHPGMGYGLSLNVKKINKKNLVAGLDIGYETMKSMVNINIVDGFTGSSTYQYTASGQTFLNYNFINLYPQLGYRFNKKSISFDLTGGFDIAYCLNGIEKGSATATNGTKYTTSLDRKTINRDIRSRIQLSADYHRSGIYLGYSHGLSNYTAGYIGGTGSNESNARLIRFGLTYRLKQFAGSNNASENR